MGHNKDNADIPEKDGGGGGHFSTVKFPMFAALSNKTVNQRLLGAEQLAAITSPTEDYTQHRLQQSSVHHTKVTRGTMDRRTVSTDRRRIQHVGVRGMPAQQLALRRVRLLPSPSPSPSPCLTKKRVMPRAMTPATT